MKRIYWLASYPKSGNTWMRAVLENVLGGDQAADINRFGTAVHGSAASRLLFDRTMAIDSTDLTEPEIACLRPGAYRALAAAATRSMVFKVHDGWTLTCEGAPVFPTDVTGGAVYIIRNPLDVAVSFAHHFGVDVDTAIARMNDGSHALGRVDRDRGPGTLLRQDLGSWSDHVRGWTEVAPIPIHVLRYEDMHAAPEAAFTAALAFLGYEAEPARLRIVLHHASFAQLRAQEDQRGFREVVTSGTRFFREGRTGAWRDVLNTGQVTRIVEHHGEIMDRFGYLPDDRYRSDAILRRP